VHKWRQNYEHFLQNARQRYTPSIDTSQRLQPYFPELEFVVRPHLFVPTPSKLLTSTGKNDTRSIAIIGAIGKHKGSQIVLDCARLAHARDYPVHFNVVGYTDINKELAKLPNVTITGAYTEDTVHTILDDLNCEIAWFPAVWPETFSYTLSIALEVGLFPVAFDMGAISSRLRKIDWGYLMPIQKMTRPSAVLSELINIEPTPVPDDLHAQIVHRYDNLLGDYYGIADAFGVPEHANS